MQFSEDGWTFVFGAKLAGIKVIFPWIGIENFYQQLTKNEFKAEDLSEPNEFKHMFRHAILGLGFAGITYLFQR